MRQNFLEKGKVVPAVFFFFVLGCGSLWAGTSDKDVSTAPAVSAADQARRNYRAYLDELKSLNEQYKQVTGEIKKIVKEEGLPQWDDAQDGVIVSAPEPQARINENQSHTLPKSKDAKKEVTVPVS